MSGFYKKIYTKLNKLKNRKAVVDIVHSLLIFNFSFFILFSIYSQKIAKACLVIGVLLYISLKIYSEKNIKSLFRNFFPSISLNKPLFAFLLACLFSVFFSYDIYNSQQELFNRMIPYLAFFYMGVFLAQKEKRIKLLIFFMLIGSAIAGVGSVAKVIRIGELTRIEGVWGDPITTYFLCGFSFLLCFSFFHSSKKIKLLSTLAGISVLAGLLLGYFRGAWVALFLSVLIASFLFRRFRKVGLGIIIFILVCILIFPFFRTRLFSDKTLQPSTWGDRVPLWNSAIEMFLDFPILGIGLGGFEKYNHEYGQGNYNKLHAYSHNVYLDVLSEIGALGLFSFLWVFFVFFKRIYKE